MSSQILSLEVTSLFQFMDRASGGPHLTAPRAQSFHFNLLHRQPWPWLWPLGHVAVCPLGYTVRLKSRAELLAKTWLFQNILEQTRAAYSFVVPSD